MKLTRYLVFVCLYPISSVIYSVVANEPKTSQNNVLPTGYSSLSMLKKEGSGNELEDSWININMQLDGALPVILEQLHNTQVEHLHLPDMRESISLIHILGIYQAHLILNNGIVYNVEGIEREGDALMAYDEKTFLIRFDLIISNLQFEYDFLLQLTPFEGYGKVIGSLDDTIIHLEISVDVTNISLTLDRFRIVQFRKIHVQVDETKTIRHITGIILTPITNLFKDRIITSISLGLEKEMRIIFDEFNDGDFLQLRIFAKRLVAGLAG